MQSVYENGWIIKAIEHEGRPIGFTMYGYNGEEGFFELCRIMIDRKYQNRGCGSRLLHETERAAKENGAYILLTQASDWNADFFFKNGYTVRGTLEDYPKGRRSYELKKLL